MKKDNYDVAVVGSGIVGLSAAIYCGRLKLKTIVIGKESGGTIVKTHIVENYPGFSSISGQDLISKVLEHVKDYNIEMINSNVEKIFRGKNCFNIQTKNRILKSKTIILCTGSEWRKLGIPGEKEFANKGVHYCALCDGPFYKNKTIVVVGGGDSATKESLLLSKYGKKVYLIARSKIKPEPINLERVKAETKIEIIEETEVKQINGTKFVESIFLSKKFKGENELKVDALFIDIGHIPLSSLADEIGVETNKNKEIIIDKESKTNIKGIYAAGDVTDSSFKQAITGVGEAVKAVYSAYTHIHNESPLLSCVDEN